MVTRKNRLRRPNVTTRSRRHPSAHVEPASIWLRLAEIGAAAGPDEFAAWPADLSEKFDDYLESGFFEKDD
jgi:hypothetical protein